MTLLARLRAAVGLFALTQLAACATTGGKQNIVYLIKVDKGDTVAGIARKYDTTPESILALSSIPAGTAPKVGQILRVAPGPGGLIAGADGRAGPRLARRGPAAEEAVEFTEDDIPSDDGKTQKKMPAKGGLLFNNKDDGAASRSFFHWPVQGPLGSRFGMRHGRPHKGIDIRAKYGTDILASGPGVVEFVGHQSGFGRVIIVKHGQWRTVYGHLSSFDVSQGDRVTRATVLGEVGTSGNASGPHLHFEIHDQANRAVDPLTLLGGASLLSKN